MVIPIALFLLGWVTDIAAVWFVCWNKLLSTKKVTQGLGTVLMYAILTRHHYDFPPAVLFAMNLITHLITIVTLSCFYAYTEKKWLIIGAAILAIFPNAENPYRIETVRLCIRLLVYLFIMWRLKPNTGLDISIYVRYAWILFTNELCLVLLPFHVVYDSYYYIIDTNV